MCWTFLYFKEGRRAMGTINPRVRPPLVIFISISDMLITLQWYGSMLGALFVIRTGLLIKISFITPDLHWRLVGKPDYSLIGSKSWGTLPGTKQTTHLCCCFLETIPPLPRQWTTHLINFYFKYTGRNATINLKTLIVE